MFQAQREAFVEQRRKYAEGMRERAAENERVIASAQTYYAQSLDVLKAQRRERQQAQAQQDRAQKACLREMYREVQRGNQAAIERLGRKWAQQGERSALLVDSYLELFKGRPRG